MANYSLVINSKFTPFTFDEMLKPVLMATEAENKQQEQYAALMTEAEEWGAKANQQTDPVAYMQYKRYADQLAGYADRLAKYGLSQADRIGIMNMRKRYASEIVPIKEAYVRREKLADEQRQRSTQDSTLRFSNDFSTMSLDKLLENPTLSYTALSGKELMANTMTLAAQLAKGVAPEPLQKQYEKVMGSQYWQIRKENGWTNVEILKAMINDPKAPEALVKLKEMMHATVSGNAAYNKDWADSYINLGLYGAAGAPTFEYQRDLDYVSGEARLQASLERERIRSQERMHSAQLEASKAPRVLVTTGPKFGDVYYDPNDGGYYRTVSGGKRLPVEVGNGVIKVKGENGGWSQFTPYGADFNSYGPGFKNAGSVGTHGSESPGSFDSKGNYKLGKTASNTKQGKDKMWIDKGGNPTDDVTLAATNPDGSPVINPNYDINYVSSVLRDKQGNVVVSKDNDGLPLQPITWSGSRTTPVDEYSNDMMDNGQLNGSYSDLAVVKNGEFRWNSAKLLNNRAAFNKKSGKNAFLDNNKNTAAREAGLCLLREIAGLSRASDDELKPLLNRLYYYGNYSGIFGSNEFAVTFPGMGPDGKVYNKGSFDAFINYADAYAKTGFKQLPETYTSQATKANSRKITGTNW